MTAHTPPSNNNDENTNPNGRGGRGYGAGGEIKKRIAAPHIFLDLYEADTIIGTLDYMPTPPEIQLIDVTVKEPYRNKGYGKRLMQELVNIAKKENCTKIFLEVRVSNAAARHLYDSFGFSETGKRKNYYSGPTEDAVLMEYTLR